mmetsp:Transcript_15210/g.51278  ORF Transcript_15210/g.51278 Transcript_15210/m.51278 type:complete len:348 (-) Transcript_15210:46-1089(-)
MWDAENGLKSWQESGRLSFSYFSSDNAKEYMHKAEEQAATSKLAASETVRTVRLGMLLKEVQARCQHVLLLDQSEGPSVCPNALHVIRYAVAKADNFWGSWSILRFSRGVSGMLLPCAELEHLGGFVLEQAGVASFENLVDMWFSKDAGSYPQLKKWQPHLPAGQQLLYRHNLIQTQDLACAAPFVLANTLLKDNAFHGDCAQAADFSPCHVVPPEPFMIFQNAGDKASHSSSSPSSAKDFANVHEFDKLPDERHLVSGELGVDCETTCGTVSLGCQEDLLDIINNCDALKIAFPGQCKSCSQSEGNDQPAIDVDAGICLTKADKKGFTCKASHPKTRRACVCGKGD